MTESTEQSASQGDAKQDKREPLTLPPFTRKRFERQLLLDRTLGWLFVAAIVLGLVVSGFLPEDMSFWWSFGVAGIFAFWIISSVPGMRVAQRIPRIAGAVIQHQAQAEHAIAQSLKHKPLPRTVRLALYHHLAVLRHRQERYGESADICAAVLSRLPRTLLPLSRTRISEDAEGTLLLLQGDSLLQQKDYIGLYQVIMQLHSLNRTLVQTLQLTALQTQYELAIGAYDSAISGVQHKVKMAEIMPAPQAGAMHALLAVAADKTMQSKLADWLRHRAQLLCSSTQLRKLQQGVIWFDDHNEEPIDDLDDLLEAT